MPGVQQACAKQAPQAPAATQQCTVKSDASLGLNSSLQQHATAASPGGVRHAASRRLHALSKSANALAHAPQGHIQGLPRAKERVHLLLCRWQLQGKQGREKVASVAAGPKNGCCSTRPRSTLQHAVPASRIFSRHLRWPAGPLASPAENGRRHYIPIPAARGRAAPAPRRTRAWTEMRLGRGLLLNQSLPGDNRPLLCWPPGSTDPQGGAGRGPLWRVCALL